MSHQDRAGSGLPARAPEGGRELWLLGQPSLRGYLEFVKDEVIGGEGADLIALAAEWRAANECYQELERTEYGTAEQVEQRDLDPRLADLAAEVRADSRFTRTFDVLPAHVGMVELGRLVVAQKQVNLDLVDSLATRVPPGSDPRALFRFCLPLGQPDTPVEVHRIGSHRFLFRSRSQDFRLHESVCLGPDQVRGYETFGPLVGVAGAVVAFGSNFLNVIRVGNRLLLNDGYHRACALRRAGVTHAPCVIQTVSHPEEISVVAKRRVVDDPEFYFHSARPPLLKDFFDLRLCKVLPVRRSVRVIEVSIEVREYQVPE
jgi:hypothetical protein